MLQLSAGGIVVGPDGRIAVVNQNNDSWSLPKGRVETNEDEQTAALREIYEETGLSEVKIIKKLGTYERPTIGKGGKGDDYNHIKRITFFLCSTNQAELHPVDPDNPEAIWMNPNEVEEKLSHLKDKEFYRLQLPKIADLLSQP
jgi:ADP-ribose pyrophosphatase YjhB (NUDIX family)